MNSRKLTFLLTWVGAALVAVIAFLIFRAQETSTPVATVTQAPRTAPGTASETASSADADLWSDFGKTAEPPAGLLPPGTRPGDAPPEPIIDLALAREELPDNLYWKMLAPTSNKAIQAARDREKKRLNDEYGRVLSNTASPAQIRGYYAYKERLSRDYIRLLQYLLKKYDGQLTEKQEGLFKLGIELHAARIEQSPDDVARALERKQAYDAKKAEWQARK